MINEQILKIIEASKRIKPTELLEKICVSKPYFNFDLIYQSPCGMLVAPLRVEQQNFESDPISLGEAMRHLAILGSCSYAINQEEKQFYLACKSNGLVNRVPFGGTIYAAMKPTHINHLKNKLVCEGGLYNGRVPNAHLNSAVFRGVEISQVRVEYQILKPRVFERFFSSMAVDYQKSESSPYTTNFPLEIIGRQGNKILAKINPFDPAKCSGHFDGFPIVPIAFLCSSLAELASKISKRIPSFKNFKAEFFSVLAPSKPIFLAVEEHDETSTFECIAMQDDKKSVHLLLSTYANPEFC